jgi:hypothetical protein
MSSRDPEIEPVEGLPRNLPPGEHIVWQGRPDWRAMARTTFKTRWVALYFVTFFFAHLALSLRDHQDLGRVWMGLGLAVTCLAILHFLAWLNAGAAMYTITTKRIVMRVGVALPLTWNLPFKRLAAADLNVRKDGDGDIYLQLVAPDRIAWLQLWPHAQPGKLAKARPALRAIAEPRHVAKLLADAMQTWAAKESTAVQVAGRYSLDSAAVSSEHGWQHAPSPLQIAVQRS